MPKKNAHKAAPSIDTTPPRPELAALPGAIELLRKNEFDTIAEAAIFCAAIPETTIGAIVKQQKMPFSTVSRVAYALEQRGLLTYTPHPTDRRKKIVRANVEALL